MGVNQVVPIDMESIIKQPQYSSDWPPDVYPFNAPNETLNANDSISISYSHEIT